jgi:CDP-diacylglycerol--glycerol-3-phosphate 3-phosphatidyltransferase
MNQSFGPTALATPANAITVVRILVSPLLFAMITGSEGSWAASAVWTALCVTDGIDGYLARRHGATRSGAFLDPLADKVLVLGAMFALVAHDQLWFVPVGLIAVRELAISLYRSIAGKRGITVPARTLAKVKTVLQQLAVGFAMLPLTSDVRWLIVSTLWLAVGLTVLTGMQYFLDAGRVAREQRRPRLVRAA